MAALRFRNLEAKPTDPVETWPTEGVMAALERGDIQDWARIAAAVRADPWGPVARRLEDALTATRPYGTATLMETYLSNARAAALQSERDEVARRVKSLFERSALSRAEFAEALGTSTSRLSTYLTGKVAPASTLMVRMERVSKRARG